MSCQNSRGQVILRHTNLPTYRCFLPDLAEFAGFCCTGPSPYMTFRSPIIWRRGWSSKSRDETRAPARGPRPLAPSLRSGHPLKGEYPLQNPSFESHRNRHFRCNHSKQCLAERVGFEPTVPSPVHVISNHADSATLAPLRTWLSLK